VREPSRWLEVKRIDSVRQTLNVTLGKGEGEPSRWLETRKWKA
jgi:hypothetical protein